MSSKLRIIPLGGCGEIGKNMTAIEYDDHILIIDAGIMFPENDMLGIDYIIPDYNYLMDKLDKIEGILFTHGHEDHVGAVGHVMKDIKAPIYATPLTVGLLENKLQRAGLLKSVTINPIQAGDVFQVGIFTVEPFHMAHSIPDCVGFGIGTPAGLIVHSGDYKFDHTPVDGWPPDFAKLAEFAHRGVLCLMADSTNAEREGWTLSESVITAALDDVFSVAEGRVIVASFASLVSRIQQVANAAYKHGRKLAITGRSMRDTVNIARKLGYIDIPDNMLIDISETSKLPANQVTVMATGAQGEPTSVMGRLAHGRHPHLNIQAGDTVILSAHAIPGNEETVTNIINRLLQRGANVLYEDIARVHVSGHASREEMKLLINLVRPKFLIPVHGERRHLVQHAKLAEQMGIPKDNIAIVENGTVIELTSTTMSIGERIPGGHVYVDGSGVGDIGRKVMRDRERLAESGFFMAAVGSNGTGQLLGKPEYITRGLINMDEEWESEITEVVTRVMELHGRKAEKRVSSFIEEAISRYLYNETGKRPMVFVVLK
ncbi:MAG: ribonuclease J [Chloroflexi bacterium]|nr:ribonuclease J [Chloroflexota bacterium]